MVDAATEDIKRQVAAKGMEQPATDVFMGFVHAVNWQEPLIVVIVTWHVLALLGAIATARHIYLHASLFVILCLLVLGAQPLNSLGAAQWADIATQNYFDESGIFISAMLSLPSLLILIGMLMNILWSTGSLMIAVKRAQVAGKQGTSTGKGKGVGKGKKQKGD